jgi:hypothetical protein
MGRGGAQEGREMGRRGVQERGRSTRSSPEEEAAQGRRQQMRAAHSIWRSRAVPDMRGIFPSKVVLLHFISNTLSTRIERFHLIPKPNSILIYLDRIFSLVDRTNQAISLPYEQKERSPFFAFWREGAITILEKESITCLPSGWKELSPICLIWM